MGSACCKKDLKTIRINKDISVLDLVKENRERKKEKEIKKNEDTEEKKFLKIKEIPEIRIEKTEKKNENLLSIKFESPTNQNSCYLSENNLFLKTDEIGQKSSFTSLNNSNVSDSKIEIREEEKKPTYNEIFFSSIKNNQESNQQPLISNKNNQESNQQPDISVTEKKSQTEESWLEKYNKFLERTKFKSLLHQEIPVFSTFKFTRIIIDEINDARINSLKYSEKIDHYTKFIETDKITKKKYLLRQEKLLYLPSGLKGIKECSDYLKEHNKKMKEKKEKLKKLVYAHELKFPIPKNEKKIFSNNFINNAYEKMRKDFEGIYNIINFLSLNL